MSSTFNRKKASPAVFHSTLRSTRGSRLGLTVDLTSLVEKLVALLAPVAAAV